MFETKGNEQQNNKTIAQGITNVSLKIPRIIITYTHRDRKNTHTLAMAIEPSGMQFGPKS